MLHPAFTGTRFSSLQSIDKRAHESVSRAQLDREPACHVQSVTILRVYGRLITCLEPGRAQQQSTLRLARAQLLPRQPFCQTRLEVKYPI